MAISGPKGIRPKVVIITFITPLRHRSHRE